MKLKDGEAFLQNLRCIKVVVEIEYLKLIIIIIKKKANENNLSYQWDFAIPSFTPISTSADCESLTNCNPKGFTVGSVKGKCNLISMTKLLSKHVT